MDIVDKNHYLLYLFLEMNTNDEHDTWFFDNSVSDFLL